VLMLVVGEVQGDGYWPAEIPLLRARSLSSLETASISAARVAGSLLLARFRSTRCGLGER
jgi:hypothetical protein